MQATQQQEAMTQAQINGVDLEVLTTTIQAIQKQPELGACKFQARNQWLGGTQNRTTVTGFYGACQEMAHLQPFRMEADEPQILAGKDASANPVEHLLHALASCLTTSIVAHAAVRGIEIEELESRLEGDLDLRGFLGLEANVPKGYTKIRAEFRVKARPEDLPQLRELAKFSPVFQTITCGADVDVNMSML